jgi:general stress protein 26
MGCSVAIKRSIQITALLLSFAAGALHVNAQEQKQWSREQLISAAREIMMTTRYCALITTDSSGRTHARTMDAFAPDEQMTVWLATNPRSRKVVEIRRHPHVTLYYFDRESQAYVSINGIARLVNDASEKARHWKDEWKAFYPDREKDYSLIEVRPLKLEVVNTKAGIVGDARTWRPPSVSLKINR